MRMFVPINPNGNVEVSPELFKDMLEESYEDGYVQGKIDAIMETVPTFHIAENKNQGEFFVENEVVIFRATKRNGRST